jgi:hypothetical protein
MGREITMETSNIIARLMGPILIVSAAAILLNRKGIRKTIEAGAKSPVLMYLSGFMTLLAGLAVVELHNIWVADWQTLITVTGWAMVLGGTARMLFPEQLAAAAQKQIKLPGSLEGAAIASAFVGAILSIKGF